jgi:hypothetical protein
MGRLPLGGFPIGVSKDTVYATAYGVPHFVSVVPCGSLVLI